MSRSDRRLECVQDQASADLSYQLQDDARDLTKERIRIPSHRQSVVTVPVLLGAFLPYVGQLTANNVFNSKRGRLLQLSETIGDPVTNESRYRHAKYATAFRKTLMPSPSPRRPRRVH